MKQFQSFSNKEEERADLEWRRRENFKRGREGEDGGTRMRRRGSSQTLFVDCLKKIGVTNLGARMRREELTQFECHLCGEGSILDNFQKCSMIIQAESTQIFRDIHSGQKYSFRSLPHQAQAPTSRVAWLPVCGPLPPLCQIGGVLNFASSCF